MSYFNFILILCFMLSILLSFLSFNSRMTAMQIVNNMGIGWNLANSFDCYNEYQKIKSPDEQITLWGNTIPKKEIFKRIKKYGFKTVRFPVTWMNFMEDSGKVNNEWMRRVKEIVDWIINNNMYCILNIHNDGKDNNWLAKGIKAKEKYIYLWEQIAEEFKDYNQYLIFESMNDVEYKNGDIYEYTTLLSLTQSFVDTIRNSGGNNIHRLLLISGANSNLDLTISPQYLMPNDPKKTLAISIHYYLPSQFTVEKDDDPWTWTDEQGVINIIEPMTTWGSENHYKDIFTNFEKLKKTFTDKGIPVIIVEVGVLTEQKKEINSIREFLYVEFSMSDSYEGIMSCLWDTSNKGEMNFYDRTNDKWYDEQIKNNFKKISKKRYINPKNYYIISNKDNSTNLNSDGSISLEIGTKKVLRVVFNAYITISSSILYNCGFGITSLDKNGNWIGESVSGANGKRQYDGSYTFNIDVSKQDYNNNIKIEKWWGQDYITLNFLTLEFNQYYTFFNYKEYKNDYDY